MTTIYDNKLYKIEQDTHGGYWLTNKRTGMTAHATVYDDNTVGYDFRGYTTKAMRKAFYKHIHRTTGKPAMRWANPVHKGFGLVRAED